jgi:hypothetical protein
LSGSDGRHAVLGVEIGIAGYTDRTQAAWLRRNGESPQATPSC